MSTKVEVCDATTYHWHVDKGVKHPTEPRGRQPTTAADLCVNAVLVTAIREAPSRSLAQVRLARYFRETIPYA
jgi:hypothetical protein